MSKRLGGIIGCKYKTSSWHLNGFPDGSNIGSTVYCTLTLISNGRLPKVSAVKRVKIEEQVKM